MQKFFKLLTLSVILTVSFVVNLHAVESSVEFKSRTDAQTPNPINTDGGTIYVTDKQVKVKGGDGTVTNISQSITDNAAAISTHTADTANPHSVTKTQIGLGNVDNTADADKPVSTATQTALDGKQNTITNGAAASGTAAGQVPIWNATSGLWVPGLLTPGTNISFNFTDGGITINSTASGLPAGVQGDILYYNGSGWVALNAGTSGYFLKTQGAGANPVWASAVGSGDMLASVYDPGNIAEQVVGTTATQTLANKTLTSPVITTSLNLAYGTVNTVPVLDVSGNVISSAVTSTELGYVSGVTSSIQTQLNAKANTSSLGTAAALNVGTSANNIVQLNGSGELPAVSGANLTNLPAGDSNATQLRGIDISTTTPTTGQQLVYNGTSYTPTTPAGGGDVLGPSSATSSNLASFDGTTGKAIKDSGIATTSSTITIGDGTDQDYDIIVNNGDANLPRLRYDAGDSVWQFSNDGSTFSNMGSGSGGSSGLYTFWSANAMPQDIVLSDWTNITAYPTIDYDTFKYATISVAYNAAEGMGVFCVGPIPADMTNLTITIVAAPLSSGATGTTMDWKADIVRMRPGTADTSPTAYTLGSTTFETTGVTTGSYTLSLSTISATAGDVLQLVIYPDTGAAAPKQTDRLVSIIKIGVE